MKDLLLNAFKKHYGVVRSFAVDESIFQTDFALTDEKACHACAVKDDIQKCARHEVGKFGCKDKKVIVIDYEHFIDELAGTKAGEGKKCDKIVYTSDKSQFILNELTCSQGKYIESKRAKAMIQLNQSISKLCAVPEIHQFVRSFQQQVGLFSYRIKDDENTGNSNQAIQGMQQFFQPLKAIPVIQTTKSLDENFDFVQVLYPNEYEL